MRFAFVLFLPLIALAQQPVPNPAIPPSLRQAATLLLDYGNTKRYAAEALKAHKTTYSGAATAFIRDEELALAHPSTLGASAISTISTLRFSLKDHVSPFTHKFLLSG